MAEKLYKKYIKQIEKLVNTLAELDVHEQEAEFEEALKNIMEYPMDVCVSSGWVSLNEVMEHPETFPDRFRIILPFEEDEPVHYLEGVIGDEGGAESVAIFSADNVTAPEHVTDEEHQALSGFVSVFYFFF